MMIPSRTISGPVRSRSQRSHVVFDTGLGNAPERNEWRISPTSVAFIEPVGFDIDHPSPGPFRHPPYWRPDGWLAKRLVGCGRRIEYAADCRADGWVRMESPAPQRCRVGALPVPHRSAHSSTDKVPLTTARACATVRVDQALQEAGAAGERKPAISLRSGVSRSRQRHDRKASSPAGGHDRRCDLECSARHFGVLPGWHAQDISPHAFALSIPGSHTRLPRPCPVAPIPVTSAGVPRCCIPASLSEKRRSDPFLLETLPRALAHYERTV